MSFTTDILAGEQSMEWEEEDDKDFQHTQILNDHFSLTPGQQMEDDGCFADLS